MIEHNEGCRVVGGTCDCHATCKAVPSAAPVQKITVHVACPVCGKNLHYEHTGADAWGSMCLDDFGCVEITAHTTVVGEHMREHVQKGEWKPKFLAKAEYWQRRAAQLKEF